MIPLSLRLHNFMSYGADVAPLDFASFQIACLCGDNGHGKSALLDAITWSLWGRSRARSEDDLVQLGKLDMEVEFEFALGAERYRVLRKRRLRRSGQRRIATPILELQVHDGEGYRPLTGDSVQATQTSIQRLLRMDYETFVNSAFIIQGKADAFTLKSPAERKRVLADLLGLERYSALEEKAREQSRRCALERQQIQAAIAEFDVELQRRPEYESALAIARARIAEADARRAEAAAEHHRWQLEMQDVARRDDELERRRQERTQLEREYALLERQAGEQARQVEQMEAVIARGAEARTRAARLAELREKDEQLGRVASELLSLAEERRQLEGRIARAREKVVSEQQVARAELKRLQVLATRRDTIARDLAATEQAVATMREREQRRDEHRMAAQAAQHEARMLDETNQRLRSEMAEVKERLDLLKAAGATCPVCATTLTEASRAELAARITEEGRAKGDEFRRNGARLKEFERKRADAEQAAAEEERHLGLRGELEGRAVSLRAESEEAAAAAGAVIVAAELVTRLDAEIESGAFAADDTKRLAEVTGRVQQVGYDRAGHDAIRAEITQLRGVETLLAQIAQAEASIEAARIAATQTRTMLDARQVTLTALLDRLNELESTATRRAQVEAQLARASSAVDEAIRESQAANQALGVAKQRIDHCLYLESQRAERQSSAARAGEEKTIYDELALAFGRKGIQAMIIENAIPEIEAEANELLQRLTDGQLSVVFETQREAKSGDSVIETLDILISDAYGTRDYEMYSGGEAFRVNFAIRIALSKLLARRAGAQLQLLVIDEGFGTQDATGRDRLVEAINAVASDFEKIVVVTHIQELKDAFPVRIDVVKGPEGSQVVATTVLDG